MKAKDEVFFDNDDNNQSGRREQPRTNPPKQSETLNFPMADPYKQEPRYSPPGGKQNKNIRLVPLEESKGERSEQEKFYSKDCLKLGRKLIKLLTKHLKTPRTAFANKFLTVSAKTYNSMIAFFGLEEVSNEDLVNVQAFILQKVWETLKNCLNYHKNKKICVVKSEYWNNVFDKKTFLQHAIAACKGLDNTVLQSLFLTLDANMNIFCDILFLMNLLMVLTLILKDDTPKGGQFIRKIETLNNLIVLVINPKLFDFYNHRSGKFASECCGKCKVCRSRDMPTDLAALLQSSRQTASVLVNAIIMNTTTNLEHVQEPSLFYLMTVVVNCLDFQQ